jgi:hypothetical protein
VFAHTLEHLIAEEESLDPIGDELEQHDLYLMGCRRVCVGPAVVVVFENTRTLWLRFRELARVVRLTNPDRVNREMVWYRSLLPGPGRLLASVSVRGAARDLGRALPTGSVALWAGEHLIPGTFRSVAADDRIVGLVRWVEFDVDADAHAALADETRPLTLRVVSGSYHHASAPLPAAVRASLLADLAPPSN